LTHRVLCDIIYEKHIEINKSTARRFRAVSSVFCVPKTNGIHIMKKALAVLAVALVAAAVFINMNKKPNSAATQSVAASVEATTPSNKVFTATLVVTPVLK